MASGPATSASPGVPAAFVFQTLVPTVSNAFTKRVGDISELRVMCDLVAAGFLVSIPFGENHRYDPSLKKRTSYRAFK
jgi:hypothetical protein